jgi:hypothetical protein
VAATTTDIRRDIESLTTRIETTAEELDSRLARLPRAAAWAWRHKRVLVVLNTMLLGALWIIGGRSRGSAATELEGSYEIRVTRS